MRALIYNHNHVLGSPKYNAKVVLWAYIWFSHSTSISSVQIDIFFILLRERAMAYC